VRKEIAARVAARAASDDVVVLDIPLIRERGAYDVAALVVVDAPTDVAVERVVASRAMTEEQVRARMATQPTREERLRLADRVIDNAHDRATLERQVDDVWAWMHTLSPMRR
jgi:dephospho-CoA kinase